MKNSKLKSVLVLAVLFSFSFINYANAEGEVIFFISQVSPKVVSQGEEVSLFITLKNRGVNEAYKVTAELAANESLPLKTVGENKVYIDFREQPCSDPRLCGPFNVGDTAEIAFNVKVDNNAENGVYYIPLYVYWQDVSGAQKKATVYFGIEVKGKPQIEISFNTLLSLNQTYAQILYPDTEFFILLSLKNVGKTDAKNLGISLNLSGDGEKGISGESRASFSEIKVGEEKYAKFNVKSGKYALPGKHEIPYSAKFYDDYGDAYEKKGAIEIFVQSKGEANINFAGIATDPSRIYKDTDFSLDLTLENVGYQKAKALKLSIALPEGINGEDTAFFGTIEKGASAKTTLDLKAEKDVKTGEHEIKALVEYIDEQGREIKENKIFKLFVLEKGEVNLEIAGVTTSLTKITPGSDFTLSVQVENIGKQDAKSVHLVLKPTDAKITGKFTSFLGKIDKDDSSTGIFDLHIEKDAAPGLKKIPMDIHHTDETGKEGVEEKDIEIFVSETERRDNIVYAGAAIAVVILLYLFRKRRKSAEG